VLEMVIAAVLAGVAVLIFVGSWRSTLIVALSIPLSILCSILALSWLGQTINVMTLGGLALAVGILVDDATVMIENINRHLEEAVEGEAPPDLSEAIIAAANQIVVPTFVSTLCICIVWLPLFQMGGVAGYLFLPLAEAVIFAMVASFILSRTLTPTVANWLLRGQVAAQRDPERANRRPGMFARFQRGFEARFERFRSGYRDTLGRLADRRNVFVGLYLAVPWFRCRCSYSLERTSFPASSLARWPCTSASRRAPGSRKRPSPRSWWTARYARYCPVT